MSRTTADKGYTSNTALSDEEIVALYFLRDETAISETTKKYGALYQHIAMNILSNRQDAEECENSTYLRLWNTIPPKDPDNLEAYGSKIVRNLALDRNEYNTAQKRGGFNRICEELDDSIPDSNVETFLVDEEKLCTLIDRFLREIDKESRIMFILHYWNAEPLNEIASRIGCRVPRIKSQLYRTRCKLKEYLEKEGVAL